MMSMAQTFAAHPGAIPGHPGVAHGGHPMAPGHPSNQGVPGGGQQPVVSMAQMHPGASGSGVAQVSQAGPMMVGMSHGVGGVPGVSSGGGPSAHALSHLNPGNAQIFQQHNMQQARKSVSYFLYKSFALLVCSFTCAYPVVHYSLLSRCISQLISLFRLRWPASSALYTWFVLNCKSLLLRDIHCGPRTPELCYSRFQIYLQVYMLGLL